MMKRIISLASAVVLAIFGIISFLPFFYHEGFYEQYVDTLKYESYNSGYDNLYRRETVILYVCLGLLAIALVMLILQFAKKQNIFVKIGNFIPLVAAILYFVNALVAGYETKGYDVERNLNYRFYAEPSAGYYVCGAILLIVGIMMFLIGIGVFDSKAKAHVIANDNVASGADELMKYKQLLDVGAITPEQYEAKRKQIMGM